MELNPLSLGKLLVKMGLGVAGGALAGPLAPIGGAAGYALGEFIFDEDKEYLDPEELAAKYTLKLCIFTVGGAVAGMAGEALGSSVGTICDTIGEEFFPGIDISEKVADWLVTNETVTDLLEQACNLTENSCLSEEAKVALMETYFNKFENLIHFLIEDEIMDEMVGREVVKPLASNSIQYLLEPKKLPEQKILIEKLNFAQEGA